MHLPHVMDWFTMWTWLDIAFSSHSFMFSSHSFMYASLIPFLTLYNYIVLEAFTGQIHFNIFFQYTH